MIFIKNTSVKCSLKKYNKKVQNIKYIKIKFHFTKIIL